MDAPFRFKISYSSGFRYMNPLNANGTKIKSEKEGENIFFRTKLSGGLKFVKEDFGVLAGLEQSGGRCAEVLLDVDRFCGGVYVPFWKGTFSLNDGKWNFSKCEVTFAIKPNDAYRKVMDYYTKEFNVLQIPATDTVSTQLDFSGQFEFLSVPNQAAIDDVDFSDTWALFLQMGYWVDGNLTNNGTRNETAVFYRLIAERDFIDGIAPDLSGGGWATIEENQTTQKAKYAKKPDMYNFKPYVWGRQADWNRYPDLIQIDCGAPLDSTKWIRIPDCLNIRKKVTQDRYKQIAWRFGNFSFNRNRKLLDVVQYLLQQTAPDVAPAAAADISDFFTSEINYVTGAANKVKNLLIAQKSDIISSRSSEAARKGMLSLKNLLDDLRTMFQVYWFLDAEGKFRIEHISYFETLGVYDFTDPANKKYLEGKAAYEYETSKMPRFEKLVFSEASNEDFQQGLIEYISSCVTYQEGQDTKETTISRITTDVENLIVSGNSASREGFVLICHDGAGSMLKEVGEVTGQNLTNAHISAANLLVHYWRHNRILINGLVNGKAMDFESVVKTKKQVAFSVPLCCGSEFSPFGRYITNIGSNGSLLSSEVDFKNQTITFEVVHEVTGSGLADMLRQFDDSFDLSFL